MQTENDTSFDVVIAGGGLVGATMACLLDKLKLRVALVDRSAFAAEHIPCKQDTLAFDPRVSALTAASMQLFSEIGIWQDIEQVRACTYQDMEVWDADGTGAIHFSAAAIEQAALGAIVENSVILNALYAKIATLDSVQLIAPFTIMQLDKLQVNGQQQLQLSSEEGQKLQTGLLIAADGGNSRVRELAQFTCKEWNYNHQAIVTTVRTELEHKHTALQRFMTTGPLAFLPLLPAAASDDQHYCSIVWSSVPDKTASLMALSDAQFQNELSRAIENRFGKVQWSDKRYAFPLNQRHATSYVEENIVLVGDAAHTIHPLAGQGVNLGLLDVKALAQQLTHGLAAGRSLTDKVPLERYQRQRRGHNMGMMWLMEGFKHLFAEQALPVRWLRNVGLKNIDNMTLVKNQLARRAMGLDY